MRKINPVNAFFKEIKRLESMASSMWNHGDEIDENNIRLWRSWSHEADPKDCFVNSDGMNETRPEWYGNQCGNQCKRKFIFLWRIKPNYCYRGKPYFNWDEKAAFLKESETEKIIQVIDGYEYCWGWNTLVDSTWCVWGMTMGKTCYYLRKDGKVLTEPTSVKKYFKEDVMEILNKGNRNEKRGFTNEA